MCPQFPFLLPGDDLYRRRRRSAFQELFIGKHHSLGDLARVADPLVKVEARSRLVQMDVLILRRLNDRRVGADGAAHLLPEHLTQVDGADDAGIDHVPQYLPRVNGWQLLLVTNQHQPRPGGDHGQQLLKPFDVDHGDLVHDE